MNEYKLKCAATNNSRICFNIDNIDECLGDRSTALLMLFDRCLFGSEHTRNAFSRILNSLK